MSKNLKPQNAPIEYKAAVPRIVVDQENQHVILDLQTGGVFLKLDAEAARKLGQSLAAGSYRSEGKKGHVLMTFVEDK